MRRHLSRRAVVAAAGTALAASSGCLFGSAHRGPAESLSGKVSTDGTAQRTVTVRLVTSDGGTDFAESYDLADHETAEFAVRDPADEYTLAVETNGGVARDTDWDVTPCSNHVTVTVGSEAVGFRFTNC